jgi:hypothetical protein
VAEYDMDITAPENDTSTDFTADSVSSDLNSGISDLLNSNESSSFNFTMANTTVESE